MYEDMLNKIFMYKTFIRIFAVLRINHIFRNWLLFDILYHLSAL